jgi:hypothetical protein
LVVDTLLRSTRTNSPPACGRSCHCWLVRPSAVIGTTAAPSAVEDRLVEHLAAADTGDGVVAVPVDWKAHCWFDAPVSGHRMTAAPSAFDAR